MPVTLHRCSAVWVKIGGHPCWRVQRELDAAGIEYTLAKEHPFKGSKRTETIAKTGQSKLPWIEFEDGGVLREESAALAERIKSGHLFDGHPSDGAEAPAAPAGA